MAKASCRVQYLDAILTIATLATVVGAQRRSGNEQHLPWAQRTGRRMLSQQWHVQMPPQHRLLPAQNSFLAVCAVVKVGYIQVRQHTSILTLTHRMSTKTLWSGWCTTWRLVWATFTCARKCVHMFPNIILLLCSDTTIIASHPCATCWSRGSNQTLSPT